jgi:steroid delta-isomerase-like uncharacterized protein
MSTDTTTATDTATATGTRTGSDIRSIVLDWTQAMDRHDPDAFAGYMSEDCVFTNTGTGERLVGRDAMRKDLIDLLARWSDLRIEVVNLLVSGDFYTKEWVMTGVHTGDMPGLPATGRPFRILGAGVGRLRDGEIVEVTEYWNLADFLGQVGVLPPLRG